MKRLLCFVVLLTASRANAQDFEPLHFGGQARFRYEYLGEPDTRTSRLLVRSLVHGDLSIARPLRIFAQLGSFSVLDATRAPAKPPDADALAVTQLFVEATVTLSPMRLTARLGRQEMSLGSARWVGTRDGTNMRQAFDLLRVTARLPGRWRIDTFFGTQPEPKPGVLNNAPAWRDAFWGLYATFGGLDVFYLGRSRHDATYAGVTGRDSRHSIGLRIFGDTAFGLEYITHALLQLGSFEGAPIRAWALSAALWQPLPGAFSPLRFGVRSDALSGDDQPGRGALHTFHPLFANQSFFGALPAIYPSNLYDIHPLVRFHSTQLDVEAGCVFFWRQAVNDAVYEPPGVLRAGGSTQQRYTGAQLSVGFVYRANQHLTVNVEYSQLFAERAQEFLGAWTTYTF